MFSDKEGSTKCKCNRAGYKTKGTCSVAEVMCNPGEYSEECDNCHKCPAGTYGEPPKPCQDCKNGSISGIGAAKCTCCPEDT